MSYSYSNAKIVGISLQFNNKDSRFSKGSFSKEGKVHPVVFIAFQKYQTNPTTTENSLQPFDNSVLRKFSG